MQGGKAGFSWIDLSKGHTLKVPNKRPLDPCRETLGDIALLPSILTPKREEEI